MSIHKRNKENGGVSVRSMSIYSLVLGIIFCVAMSPIVKSIDIPFVTGENEYSCFDDDWFPSCIDFWGGVNWTSVIVGGGNYPGDVFVNVTGDPMTGDLNSSATLFSKQAIRTYEGADYINLSSTGNMSITGEICFDSDGGTDACISDATNAGNVGELFFNAESIITPDYLDWYFCANGDGSGLFEPVWQADCSGFFSFSSTDASLKPNRQFRLNFPDNVVVQAGNLTVAGNISTDNKVNARQGVISQWDILTYSVLNYVNITAVTGSINLTGNITGQNWNLLKVPWSVLRDVPSFGGISVAMINAFVNRTGDIMTGDLNITRGGGYVNISGDGDINMTGTLEVDERIGINTPNLWDALTINGNISFSAGEDAHIFTRLRGTSTSADLFIHASPGGLGTGGDLYLYPGVGAIFNGDVLIGVDPGTGATIGRVGIGTLDPSYTLEINNGTSGNSLNVSDVLFVNSNMGSVGINTTTPFGDLHIQSGKLYTKESLLHYGLMLDVDGTQGDNNYGSVLGYAKIGSNSHGLRAAISFVQTSPNANIGGLAFFTHASTSGGADLIEAMRIEGDGQVGIGTTDPTADLHVSGNLNVSGNIEIGGCLKYNGGTLGTCI